MMEFEFFSQFVQIYIPVPFDQPKKELWWRQTNSARRLEANANVSIHLDVIVFHDF